MSQKINIGNVVVVNKCLYEAPNTHNLVVDVVVVVVVVVIVIVVVAVVALLVVAEHTLFICNL